MQDQFVGDVGDFGKYGLLRALTAGTLRLGVVWYKVADQGGNHGRHTSYLRKPHTYRACDPELFDSLQRLVEEGKRQVASVKGAGILPAAEVFFEKDVPRGAMARQRWHDAALAATKNCDLVFLDPDKRIAGAAVTRNQGKAIHYAFADEINSYLAREQSVVVYHHLEFRRHADQIRDLLSALASGCSKSQRPFAVRYRRGTARAFVVLPTGGLAATLRERAGSLLKGPFADHFDAEVYEPARRLLELRDQIRQIAARHGAGNLSLFGSEARGTARNDSDVDLLVDVVGETSPWFPGSLVADLQGLLGRPVHVVIRRSLSP
jgi:predicted nucleotidyltransferase